MMRIGGPGHTRSNPRNSAATNSIA